MILKVKFSELSCNLGVNFLETLNTFDVKFSESSQTLLAKFGEIQTVTKYVGGDPYDGDYMVTPKVIAQTMPTKDKVLVDDVHIASIPYFDVSNNSGGSTVYIAKEI